MKIAHTNWKKPYRSYICNYWGSSDLRQSKLAFERYIFVTFTKKIYSALQWIVANKNFPYKGYLKKKFLLKLPIRIASFLLENLRLVILMQQFELTNLPVAELLIQFPETCSQRVRDSRWWGSLTMVLVGNKVKRLSSVNHTTKTMHHHHHHHHHHYHQLLSLKEKSIFWNWNYSDHFYQIFSILKNRYEQMSHKIITYHHIENILKNSFKEAVRYDSPYSEDGNLTFLQNIIEKRLH